jgi:hypothetical protein
LFQLAEHSIDFGVSNRRVARRAHELPAQLHCLLCELAALLATLLQVLLEPLLAGRVEPHVLTDLAHETFEYLCLERITTGRTLTLKHRPALTGPDLTPTLRRDDNGHQEAGNYQP